MSWQLLSKLDSLILYFVPEAWERWNKVASGKGVFSTGRRAVFELYRKASHEDWSKLTLRVLRSDSCPELLKLIQECKQISARPLRRGKSKDTEGVAFWYRNQKGVRTLSPLPQKKFSDQDEFNRWIQDWTDKNPGPWAPQTPYAN